MSNYAFVHKGKAYTPNGAHVAADKVEEHNKRIETRELAIWKEQPERFVGYYSFPAENDRAGKTYRRSFCPLLTGARLCTWTGVQLGVITKASVHPNNFGGRLVSLTVQGSNGAIYHGRASYDGGDFIRLRRAV